MKSTDGRKWTDHGSLDIRKRDGKPIDPGPYGTPTAWFENGTWYLFYERGDQGVWLATSKDLKVWTNVQDDPVIAMGPEPYDKTAVALNQIVKRDGLYYAFYHANSNRPWKNWTTCVARSRDLVHWEKYPGNPIIQNNCSSAILVQTPQGEDRLYTMHPDVKVFVPNDAITEWLHDQPPPSPSRPSNAAPIDSTDTTLPRGADSRRTSPRRAGATVPHRGGRRPSGPWGESPPR